MNGKEFQKLRESDEYKGHEPLFDQIGRERIRRLELTTDEAISLGFRKWSEHGKILLVPYYLLPEIDGDVMVKSIAGGLLPISDANDDTRFGLLSVGIVPMERRTAEDDQGEAYYKRMIEKYREELHRATEKAKTNAYRDIVFSESSKIVPQTEDSDVVKDEGDDEKRLVEIFENEHGEKLDRYRDGEISFDGCWCGAESDGDNKDSSWFSRHLAHELVGQGFHRNDGRQRDDLTYWRNTAKAALDGLGRYEKRLQKVEKQRDDLKQALAETAELMGKSNDILIHKLREEQERNKKVREAVEHEDISNLLKVLSEIFKKE